MNSLRNRRSFVAKLAVASVALTAVATGVALPASKPKPIVDSKATTLADGVVTPGFARTVHADTPTQLVGFTWKGQRAGSVEVRAKKDGQWGNWEEIDGSPSEGPDKTSKEFRNQTSAGPIWLGHGVEDVEMRVAKGDLSGLRMHRIRSDTGSTRGIASASANAGGPQIPGIIGRAGWGADESWRSYASGCNGRPDYASTVRYAVFHHTDTTNDYSPGDSASIVRGIYQFHTHTNGWCDIGYNFLVDKYGQVFEGRWGGVGQAVIGAHAGGFNTESTGVAVLGNFQSTPVPSAAYDATRRLLAWKLALTNVNAAGTVTVTAGAFDGSKYPAGSRATIWAIGPHRDVDQTGCPGDAALSAVANLRGDVQNTIVGAQHSWPAIVRGITWFMKQSYTSGAADWSFTYGETGDIPLIGDWNGDGIKTPGVYRPRNATFYLKNSFGAGNADMTFLYGNLGDRPIVGDWNNDGFTTVGLIRNEAGPTGRKFWYLKNANVTGNADISFTYGYSGDVPLAGDWNGDGADSPGVQRGNAWYLKNSNTSGAGDISFTYGNAGDYSIVGDWNKDGIDTPGVVRGSTWFLRNSFSAGNGEVAFSYGYVNQGDIPKVW